MKYLLLLWPVVGIFCAFASTPKATFKRDRCMYAVASICGAIAGPLGVYWFGAERPE